MIHVSFDQPTLESDGSLDFEGKSIIWDRGQAHLLGPEGFSAPAVVSMIFGDSRIVVVRADVDKVTTDSFRSMTVTAAEYHAPDGHNTGRGELADVPLGELVLEVDRRLPAVGVAEGATGVPFAATGAPLAEHACPICGIRHGNE
jgi:hypothetical protein